MSHISGVALIDSKFDPRLNPISNESHSKFGVENIWKIVETEVEYYKPTFLGSAAKNLIVREISSDADYQANFS